MYYRIGQKLFKNERFKEIFKRFTVVFAFLGAVVLGKALGRLLDYCIWKAFKLEPLKGMDALFLPHN
jgi:F0F1-type ATP synthase assembly protein I